MTIFNKGLLQLKIKDMYGFICDESRLTVNDQHSTFKCLGTLGIHYTADSSVFYWISPFTM